MILGGHCPLSACGERVGRGAPPTSEWLEWTAPSARPSPRKRREGEEEWCHHPKPKEGRRFRQPPGVAVRSLAHPGDGRAAVAAGSVPLTGKGRGTPRSNGRKASAGRSPGRGRIRRAAFPPRCPCDPFAPCGAPASRSGHRSTRSPKGRFIRSPRVGPSALRLDFRRGCGCIFPALPEGAAAPLQPAPPGPKTGFASMAFSPARCPKTPAPALPPVTPGTRPGMPLDACPFRSRKADANIAFTVSRGGVPVPFDAVSRRHLHGSGRDKHLISLWFPAASASACPMMLSRFSSRTKCRSSVTTCG